MNNLEMVMDHKIKKGGASVEEAIAAVTRLSAKDRVQLLDMLMDKYSEEVPKILTEAGF